MFDIQQIAIEAVRARYDNSPFYNEYLRELEAAGCSSAKIADLLEYAKTIVPHPQTPRALRILKRAAKSATRGDGARTERLRAIACELVGESQVFALVEEHRMSLVVKPAPVPERAVRCGFAAV